MGEKNLNFLVEIVNPIPAEALEFQELRGKNDRRGDLPKNRPEAG
jgi:hypothetical protein